MIDEQRRRAIELAMREGCDTTKNGVLDVLLRDGSFDVQACPGSGKTTTVAMKIVLLLDGWRSRGGICVLTHTNVAREEIQKKLRASSVGCAALGNPHFVGTIQSFVDSFLGCSYLRSNGFALEQIDNDAFASAAEDEYRNKYHSLRTWLKNKNAKRIGGVEDRRYRTVEYAVGTDELTFGGKDTGLKSKNTNAYRDLKALKETLSQRGIFRHGDMYYFANRYLDEYPWAVDALRCRFPVVIIDEMQDTSIKQEALLNRLFPPELIGVQRFGDINQKIFDMEDSADEVTSFPRHPVIDLGESRRFGGFIARTIATIAPRQQIILGDEALPRGKHAILLFDERSVFDVIPHFARLAAAELENLNETPIVKAIGNRKRSSADGGTFPNYIGSYVKDFISDAVANVTGQEGLRLRVERAKIDMKRDPFAGPAQIIIAIRMIIVRWGASERPQQVIGRIMQNNKSRRRLGQAVLALLATEAPDEFAWNVLVEPLLELLAENVGFPSPPKVKLFSAWTELLAAPIVDGFDDFLANLPLRVDIQTIHSVKGENHHATLVLETQYKNHDVSMILSYLTDPKIRKKELGIVATMHHRRMFVAMSRPRRLLCLAAAAANVSNDVRDALLLQGWDVVDLSG